MKSPLLPIIGTLALLFFQSLETTMAAEPAKIAPLPKQVFVVPNFHPASCGWLANWSVERNYCANNYLEHLNRVGSDTNYAFAISECSNMIAILNFAPDRFAELKQRIKEGRVEPVDAFFLEPEIGLSGGEALAKMGIEGLRWQEKMLGVRPRYCWMIDTCGIHDQMPQHCLLHGLDALVYNICARTNKCVFWSESPDRSQILTFYIGTYANNLGGLWPTKNPISARQLDGVAKAISSKLATTPADAPVLMLGGHGDSSRSPARAENPAEFLEAWKRSRPDCEMLATIASLWSGHPAHPIPKMMRIADWKPALHTNIRRNFSITPGCKC